MTPVELYTPSTAGRAAQRSLVERFLAWFQKRSDQIVDRAAFNTLRQLDDRQLRDIGLTREDVDWAASLPLSEDAAKALRRSRRTSI